MAHAAATDADAAAAAAPPPTPTTPLTAESVPLDAPAFELPGGLLVTTHFAADVGLVGAAPGDRAFLGGSDSDEDGGGGDADGGPAAAAAVDDATVAAMAALGLPTAFGAGGGVHRRRREERLDPAGEEDGEEEWRQQEGGGGDHARSRGSTATAATAATATAAAAPAWHQAYDAASGHFYYYNEALRVTQWQPPAEGFAPCVGVWAAGGGGVGSGADGGSGGTGGGGAADGATAASGVLLGAARPGERREGSGLLPAGTIARAGGGGGRNDADAGGHHVRWPASDDGDDEGAVEGGAGSEARGAENAPTAAAAAAAADSAGPSAHARGRKQRRAGGSCGGGAGGVRLDAATAARVRRRLPRAAAKYWLQRYSLFSRFDAGCRLDAQGWYSVTPEALAAHQAARAAAPAGVAVDAFAGCGGNAIQLAATCGAVSSGMPASGGLSEGSEGGEGEREANAACISLCAHLPPLSLSLPSSPPEHTHHTSTPPLSLF